MLKQDEREPLVDLAIVISGRITGVGKSAVAEQLVRRNSKRLVRIVTGTTRQLRPNEKNGIDYFQMTDEVFLERVAEGKMWEYTTKIPGRYYGVPIAPIIRAKRQGLIPLFVTDRRGLFSLQDVGVRVERFWITADDETVERRICGRETCSVEIAKRLDVLRQEEGFQIPDGVRIIPNLDGALLPAVARCESYIFAA